MSPGAALSLSLSSDTQNRTHCSCLKTSQTSFMYIMNSLGPVQSLVELHVELFSSESTLFKSLSSVAVEISSTSSIWVQINAYSVYFSQVKPFYRHLVELLFLNLKLLEGIHFRSHYLPGALFLLCCFNLLFHLMFGSLFYHLYRCILCVLSDPGLLQSSVLNQV